jgi:glutamate mutase epsilon subunit
MDITGLVSFSSALKGIEKTKNYITKSDEQYFVVPTKDANMNTLSISQTALEALSCLDSAPLSYKPRNGSWSRPKSTIF